jgi:hypothetical protein
MERLLKLRIFYFLVVIGLVNYSDVIFLFQFLLIIRRELTKDCGNVNVSCNFMTDRLFQGYSTFSNHGTSQGIIPRFYLQMVDMAKFALDQEALSEKLQQFLDTNISDFTEFYDIYIELRETYIDYREGLTNRKYYSIDERGAFRHDRSKELILKKKTKDFFIQGRLVVYNFGKSGVIDDKELGCISNFRFCKNT